MSVQESQAETEPPTKSIELELTHRAVAELNHAARERGVDPSEVIESRLCLSPRARDGLDYLATEHEIDDTHTLNYLLTHHGEDVVLSSFVED